MAGVLTTARIVCKSTEARDTVIESFRKIIAYTTPNEPEVLQYVCALPVDDTLKTEIYMIEEYASPAANDAHMATKPVQDLIQLFSTSDVLAQPPEVHTCPISSKHTSGIPPPISSNPAILLVNVGYKAGTTANALESWRNFTKSASSSVKELNLSIVVEDKETNSIRAEYVLDSWGAIEGFRYLASEENRTGEVDAVKIRVIDGYIGREDRSKL
ncbi:hypothetical protein BKA66DRAFT_515729 [Pyrenochaeta sp. MPI-SDFR-AT-0127]|nr:hypothetical protein BKA66DRAFT_515729 [Pyrenochaeta sp. MPI-SDFR-AT-0127]